MNGRTWDSRGAGRGLKQLMEEGLRGISSKEREGILGQGKRAFPRSPSPASATPVARARTPPRARLQSGPLPAPHLTIWNSFPESNSNRSCCGVSLRSRSSFFPASLPVSFPRRALCWARLRPWPAHPEIHDSAWEGSNERNAAPERRYRLISPPAQPQSLAPVWETRGADGRAGSVRGRECGVPGAGRGGRRATRGP